MSKENIVCGIHAVRALLSNKPELAKVLYVQETKQEKIIKDILQISQEIGCVVKKVDNSSLAKITGTTSHQGIAAFIKPLKVYDIGDFENLLSNRPSALILILDGIQDPQNLGACLRNADAAKVDFVIFPRDKASDITSVVHKVACGATFTVPIAQVTNISRAINQLQKLGIWVIATAASSKKSLFTYGFSTPTAIVLGAEGDGIRQNVIHNCDDEVFIPMYGSVSSLNVSVASGICLFEARRQRDGNLFQSGT